MTFANMQSVAFSNVLSVRYAAPYALYCFQGTVTLLGVMQSELIQNEAVHGSRTGGTVH